MKIIVQMALLVISFPVFSQPGAKPSPKKIKVGEVKQTGKFVAGLYYQVTGKDTTCVITFNNQKNNSVTDIQTISFSGKDNYIRKLYDLMSSFFGDPEKQENGYKLNIKLGNEDVVLSLAEISDTKSVMIWTSHGYFYLNEKQLNELFYG